MTTESLLRSRNSVDTLCSNDEPLLTEVSTVLLSNSKLLIPIIKTTDDGIHEIHLPGISSSAQIKPVVTTNSTNVFKYILTSDDFTDEKGQTCHYKLEKLFDFRPRGKFSKSRQVLIIVKDTSIDVSSEKPIVSIEEVTPEHVIPNFDSLDIKEQVESTEIPSFYSLSINEDKVQIESEDVEMDSGNVSEDNFATIYAAQNLIDRESPISKATIPIIVQRKSMLNIQLPGIVFVFNLV